VVRSAAALLAQRLIKASRVRTGPVRQAGTSGGGDIVGVREPNRLGLGGPGQGGGNESRRYDKHLHVGISVLLLSA